MPPALPMSSRIVIVTGATSGIGKEIAFQLAVQGATVVLACRNLARGELVADEIAGRAGVEADQIVAMRMEASSQESIREFARQFKGRFPRLDVLVNNAGANHRHRQISPDGIECTFAVNVLAYHLLTRELLALLQASAPARIVNVASTFVAGFDPDDLQFERRRYQGFMAYGQSKACNRLLTWALSRRLEGSGVTANAMAPGFVYTDLYRESNLLVRSSLHLAGVFARSPARGADTAVWLASSPQVAGVSGRFYEDRKEVACQLRDEKLEERLWEVCEGMVGAK